MALDEQNIRILQIVRNIGTLDPIASVRDSIIVNRSVKTVKETGIGTFHEIYGWEGEPGFVCNAPVLTCKDILLIQL